jgi:hypothetical protein
MAGRGHYRGDLQGEVQDLFADDPPALHVVLGDGPFERRLEIGETLTAREASTTYALGMLRIQLRLGNR